MRILAADVGGTTTRFHIARADNGAVESILIKEYKSQDFSNFSQLLRQFLRDAAGPKLISFDSVCLGLPGPVNANNAQATVKLTNLPWELNAASLSREFSFASLHFINDFQALAYALDVLSDKDYLVLQDIAVQEQAPRLVLGAGTGLGMAQVISVNGTTKILPSEGGHIGFSPSDELQVELWHFLKAEIRRVSWEHLVSGPGLVRIYNFFSHKHYKVKTNPHLAEVTNSPDPAAQIYQLAADHKDPAAEQAIDLFVKLYGTIAGDFALITMPYGGVYIGGGIAPKLIQSLAAGEFMRAFNDKGKMSTLASHMPVRVITTSSAGLIGATQAAMRLYT